MYSLLSQTLGNQGAISLPRWLSPTTAATGTASDIAEKLRAECFELRTNMCLGGYGATFRADWETGAITPIRATHYDDDLAVAVCRAALDVKGYTP